MVVKFLVKATIGTVIVGTSVGGSLAYAKRNQLLIERRSELARERSDLQSQLEAARHATAEEQQLGISVRAAERRATVLETLWADRRERISDGINKSEGCIRALPEMLTIVRGVTQHAEHMAEQMQRFVDFDLTGLKLQTLHASLSEPGPLGSAPPIATAPGTADRLRFLFRQEPLVTSIAESLAAFPGDVEAPASIVELSTVFQAARGVLDQAVEAQHDRDARAASASLVDPRQQQLQEDVKRSIAIGAVGLAIEAARIVPASSSATTAATAPVKEQPATDALAAMLRSDDDVAAAMKHVAELHKSAAKEPWGKDPAVKTALQALDVWARSANRFLVAQQGVAAVSAFQHCLHSLVVQINHGDQSRDDDPSAAA